MDRGLLRQIGNPTLNRGSSATLKHLKILRLFDYCNWTHLSIKLKQNQTHCSISKWLCTLIFKKIRICKKKLLLNDIVGELFELKVRCYWMIWCGYSIGLTLSLPTKSYSFHFHHSTPRFHFSIAPFNMVVNVYCWKFLVHQIIFKFSTNWVQTNSLDVRTNFIGLLISITSHSDHKCFRLSYKPWP